MVAKKLNLDTNSLDFLKCKLLSCKTLVFFERNKLKKFLKTKLRLKKKFFFKLKPRRRSSNNKKKKYLNASNKKKKYLNASNKKKKYLNASNKKKKYFKKYKKKLISFHYKKLRGLILNLKLISRFYYQKFKFFGLAKRRVFITNFLRRRLRPQRFKRTRNFGYLQFKKSTNNLFISVHNRKNRLLFSSSICSLAEKTRDRFSNSNMRLAGDKLALILQKFKLYKIEIHPYCRLHKGLRNLLWALKSKKIKILRLVDLVRTPHGFMTLPSRRRIKRRR
jgi:ribosomal protein S11